MRNSFRATKPAPRPQAARALGRALGVLDCFGERDEWTFMELCRAAALHKSTAFRVLAALERAGYVERARASGRYRAGPGFLRVERRLQRCEPVRWLALAPLEDLARATGETAHAGVLYRNESITVQVADGPHAVRTHTPVGKRAAAHASALGKALLAYFDEAELDEFIATFGLPAFTPRTLTDPAVFKASLRAARAQGYAVDDGELEDGLRCLGVAVPEPAARPFVAISVSGPRARLAPARDAETAAALTATAATIAKTLVSLHP
ncbi:MAG TPA: IclR family transcriptional regulator [Methylomirabilota bacterium]|nr:IclR family transcriptional regulator [Methylomirabilota bacterium]